jgi:hypothetical protein
LPVENSSSISKLNSTSYTYLGHVDFVHSASGSTLSSVVQSMASPIQKISRPIAGELPQDDHRPLNIIGKSFSPTSGNHPTMLHITLEDLLPPVQQAPKNSSGEFDSTTQISIIQITNPNVKFKYQIQTVSYIVPIHFKLLRPNDFQITQIRQSDSFHYYGTTLTRFILLPML